MPTSNNPLPCAYANEREVIGPITWRNLGPVYRDDRGAILDEHVKLIRSYVPADLPMIGDAYFEETIRISAGNIWIVDALDAEAGETLLGGRSAKPGGVQRTLSDSPNHAARR